MQPDFDQSNLKKQIKFFKKDKSNLLLSKTSFKLRSTLKNIALPSYGLKNHYYTWIFKLFFTCKVRLFVCKKIYHTLKGEKKLFIYENLYFKPKV